MNALQAYILSKHFTEETAAEFGAVKGASCQVKEIIEGDGLHRVVFQWVNSVYETRETSITIKDGDSIVVWESGHSYTYGDVVIYQDCFYLCTVSNNDTTFNPNKWSRVGAANSQYHIIENSSYLPSLLGEEDREMYYSIADEGFWLWDGTKWTLQDNAKPLTDGQVNTLIKLIG